MKKENIQLFDAPFFGLCDACPIVATAIAKEGPHKFSKLLMKCDQTPRDPKQEVEFEARIVGPDHEIIIDNIKDDCYVVNALQRSGTIFSADSQ